MFVEGGPDVFFEIGVMGEAARRIIRENFDEGFFVLLGCVVGVEHPVEILICLVALFGFCRPGMFLCGVIEHEVDADGHVAGAQGCGDSFKIRHGAKLGVDRAIIHD